MRLATVFEINISEWEELLVIGSYLLKNKLNLEMFEEAFPENIEKCLAHLNSIPESYARELCLEVLKESDVTFTK